MGLISVVVPVYKAEAYLCRCVDSILAQSLRTFTLLLIDDGSPDASGAICDAYAQKDSRVQVIHQANGGAASARNTGIRLFLDSEACQWLTFIDSDDWVHRDYLKTLYEAVAQTGCRLSACGFYETAGASLEQMPECPLEVMSAKAYFCGQVHKHLTYGPCNKLYHRSLLQTLRFPEGRFVEDEFFVYRALFAAETIAATQAPLYAYYCHPGSFTRGAWDPRRLDAWDAYEEQLAYFEALGDEELIKFRCRGYLENAARNWAEARDSLPKGSSVRRKMRKRIRKLIRRVWHKGYIEFWFDYDTLYTFYPLLTKGYRLGLELYRKWRKTDA